MLHSLYRAGLFAALFGLLLVPGTAWAQKEGRPHHVRDDAKLFSKETIVQVNLTIDKIKKTHGKDLLIETIDKGPDKTEATANWTKARFNDSGTDGIYIVISKDPSYYRDFVGDNTRSNGYFTTSNIEKMNEILKAGILKKDKRDAALIEVANYTLEVMNEHARTKGNAAPPPVKQKQKQQPVAQQDAGENTMPSWVGIACLIIGVLVVLWIVFAVIRSLTSMGGGYGGGGYGGGGGMGMGGGLLTGMLGGMFGAMAGMWLYNNMFGGHASYGHDGNVNWGDGNQGGAAGTPYESDTAGGGTAGGGDGDNDAGGGGGDAGGGGGDAGGGDAGGGGDWGGGGGGDAGGGGGGDWGGGGGDWGGGGGGDFGGGGGGGGGDW